MPDPADPATAILAGIRERAEYAKEYMQGDPMPLSLDDVPRLLAAVEAVLKEHQPVNRGEGLEPICGTCHRGFWPCSTYEAITRKLSGKDSSDGK
jgi:hypothetical protein